MSSQSAQGVAGFPTVLLKRFAISGKENGPWLALVAFAGLLPFLGFLFSGQILYASDQIGSPSWKFFFEQLRSGVLPLWNPYHLAGTPIFDALAGDGTYPLFLLLGTLLPIEKLVSFMFVLHTLLAGQFAYVLVRGHFRLDRFLSAALATAYMLNTNYFSHIYSGHTGKFYVLTWLPLGLYFLLGSLEKKAAWWKPLGLALTVAMMILTSHLQLTYYVLMGYFIYFAFVLVNAIRAKAFGEAGAVTLKFWAPILLGLGLCFPLIWGPYHYNEAYSVRGEGQRQTYEHSTSWSIHPEEAASLIVPEFGGINERYWGRNPFKLNSEYPGIAIWFLGLFGLLAFRRRFFWLWGSVGLLAIIYGLGDHTPFFKLFYAVIPGIKSFRAPSMILFWLAAALLLMSAQTLRLLTGDSDGAPKNTKSWEKKLLLAGLVAGGALLLAGLMSGVTYGLWNAFISPQDIPNIVRQDAARSAFTGGAIRAGLLVLGLAFALRNLLLQKRNVRGFAAALLAIVMIDLLFVDTKFIETYEFGRMFPHEAAIDRLKADQRDFRVFSMPGANPRGYLQYHEIESTDGWADQEYRAYRAYRGGDYQQNPTFMEGLHQRADGSVGGSKFLDMLNVRYLLFRMKEMPGLQVAENQSAMPRTWFTTQWKSSAIENQIETMRQSDFDPRNLTLLDSKAGLGDSKADSLPARFHSERLSAGVNRSRFRVSNDKEGILVISEVWIPYWRAKVDGKDQDLLRVNYLFRGLKLSPGDHQIDMYYHSGPLRQGLMVSLASALLLIGMGFLGYKLRG